jgi:hypothetical protein
MNCTVGDELLSCKLKNGLCRYGVKASRVFAEEQCLDLGENFGTKETYLC